MMHCMPVEHTSHGVPLEEYVLTRSDHNDQKVAEQIRDAVNTNMEKYNAELDADPVRRERSYQKRIEVLQFMYDNRPPDHEKMRWRVRLYCGHITETIRHVTFEEPIMAGSSSTNCADCGMAPARIVAWEPIGLKVDPPAADRRPRLDRRAPDKSVPPAADPVLSPREVAAELGVNYETVLRSIKRGELRAVKRGNRFYIRRSALEAFLDPTQIP